MRKLLIAAVLSMQAAASLAAPALNEVETGVLNGLMYGDQIGFYQNYDSLIGRKLKEKIGDFLIVRPDQYAMAYASNEIKANKTYKGKKLIIISCRVKSIDAGIMDEPVISCMTSPRLLSPSLFFDTDKDSIDEAAAINRGQLLDFICTGGGEVASVALGKKCRLFSPMFEKLKVATREAFLTDKGVALVVALENILTKKEKENCTQNARLCSDILNQRAANFGKPDYDKIAPRLKELGIDVEKLKAHK